MSVNRVNIKKKQLLKKKIIKKINKTKGLDVENMVYYISIS